MKIVAILITAITLIGCNTPIKFHEATSTHVAAQPASIYKDDYATQNAVEYAIKKCGISRDPDATSVWLKEDTWATVERQRERLQKIKAWADTLTDSTLRGIYLDKIDAHMKKVMEAESELKTGDWSREMEEYKRRQRETPAVMVPEPPCSVPMPEMPKDLK